MNSLSKEDNCNVIRAEQLICSLLITSIALLRSKYPPSICLIFKNGNTQIDPVKVEFLLSIKKL